jgi:hypothetical protein
MSRQPAPRAADPDPSRLLELAGLGAAAGSVTAQHLNSGGQLDRVPAPGPTSGMAMARCWTQDATPREGARAYSGWIDRLVELHVLAEHGDDVSAAAAEKWIAVDVEARQVWECVEDVCGQLQR